MELFYKLCKTPGALKTVASQTLARIPFGMLNLILILHVEENYGNYTAAGAVLAAQSIGSAVAGPAISRLLGLWNTQLVLLSTITIWSGGMLLIAHADLSIAAAIVISLIAGLVSPPISPTARTLYPKITSGKLLSMLYSVDAAAQELVWILGPLIAIFVATQINTAAGLDTAVAFILVFGTWFALSREVKQLQIPRARRNFGAVLLRPTVLIAVVIGMLFMSALSAAETAIVATSGDGSSKAGFVLAFLSLGSLVGGIFLAHKGLTTYSLTVRMLIVFFGILPCLFNLETWWISTFLFFAGIGIAPALANLAELISGTVKFSETVEAFGWSNTGQLVGAAIGSALAGIIIDHNGPHSAFLLALMLLLLAIVGTLLGSRFIPHLRGSGIVPLPETGTISIAQSTVKPQTMPIAIPPNLNTEK